MSKNYYGFEKFCELLNDSNILKKHSVMGVVKMLQLCLTEIKSDVLLKLSNEGKNDYYLDYLIVQIQKQDYLKDFGKDKINHILKDLNVSLEQLISFNYPRKLNDTIDVKLSWDEYYDNFDYLRKTQENLLLYFLNYYANELISFLDSKKTTNVRDSKKNDKEVEFESLDTYSKLLYLFNELSGIDSKKEEESKHFVDITDFIEVDQKYSEEISIIKSQIPELIDDLYSQSKEDNIYYFDCPSEIYKNHFSNRMSNYFKEVPDANELDFLVSEINYFSNPFDNRKLEECFDYSEFIPNKERYKISLKRKLEYLAPKLNKYNYKISYREDSFLGDPFVNPDAIGTLVKLEKSKNSPFNKMTEEYQEASTTNKEKKSKQLTVNQIVLLLEKLGFFTSNRIKDLPKTKKANIVSLITGYHFKGIKTRIENLEKKPSTLGEQHQKDIDKIDDILNNLE